MPAVGGTKTGAVLPAVQVGVAPTKEPPPTDGTAEWYDFLVGAVGGGGSGGGGDGGGIGGGGQKCPVPWNPCAVGGGGSGNGDDGDL